MKRLLRTIALFLTLAMALSVGALAADGDEGEEEGPRLVLHWLEGREDGWIFNEDDDNYWSDGTLAPGVDWWVVCFIQDGEDLTPVIPAGKGAAVTPLAELEDQPAIEGAPYAEYYVLIQLEGWEDAQLTAKDGGKTCTMAIPAELPDLALYTRPEFDRDAYYPGDQVNLADFEDGVLYFGCWYTAEEKGWDLLSAKLGRDSDSFFAMEPEGEGFWKITVDRDAVAANGWGRLQLDLTVQESGGSIRSDRRDFGFYLETPRLWVRWVEWGDYPYLNADNDWYDEGFDCRPGETRDLVFYTGEGRDDSSGQPINPQPVKAEDLTASEGVTIFPLADYAAEGDRMAEYYVQLTVDEYFKDYTISCGDAVVRFGSYLPEIAVCSAPEASPETYTGEVRYGPLHTDEPSYLIGTGTLERNGRVLKDLKLIPAGEYDVSELLSLEKHADGVYAVTVKPGAELPDGERRFSVEITWENENGETWTEEGWEFSLASYTTLLVSGEQLADSTAYMEDHLLGAVADKAAASVTMDAGEDKTVYLGQAYGEAGDTAQWPVRSPVPVALSTSSEALTLTAVDTEAGRYTLSCDEPGEYTIILGGYRVSFLDEDGNELPDEEMNAAFDEFWMSNDIALWRYDAETNNAAFYTEDNEKVECPYETALFPAGDYNWFQVKVTVEGETRPISEIYSDITNESAWYVPAVRFVTNKGMMAGSNGEFLPGGETTGAQFVQIMYNIAGQPGAGSAAFSGVTTQWYAAAITWAAEQGLITDTGDAALDPAADITRQQLALILYNAEGQPEVGEVDLGAFSDADQISSWALDAVKWAVSEGIINGSGGKLDPTGTTTRAQVAQLLMNYYG